MTLESVTICSSAVTSYPCTHLFCLLILHTIFLILHLVYNTIRGLNINLVNVTAITNSVTPKAKKKQQKRKPVNLTI